MSADSIFRAVDFGGNDRGGDSAREMSGDDQGTTLRPAELVAEVPDLSPRSPDATEKGIPRQVSKASHVHDLGPRDEQAAELDSPGGSEAHELESMSPTKPGQTGEAAPESAAAKPEAQEAGQARQVETAGGGSSEPRGEVVREIVPPKEDIERYELP